jgi:hypothetical protein
MLLFLELGVFDVEEAVFAPIFRLAHISISKREVSGAFTYCRFPVFRHCDVSLDLRVAGAATTKETGVM